jgi:uncharacterized protein (DUF2062 family)
MRRILQPGSPLSRRFEAAQEKILVWLQCGLAPRQLAFTLSLGFAIGCIPLLGVTTAICALVAMMLRLNMPAIQAANWVAMPLQVVLLIPFLRLGQWLFRGEPVVFSPAQLLLQIETAPWRSLMQMSGLFGQAVLAWMITAGPALLLMTVLLTPLMHRIVRLAAVSAD